MHMLSHWPCETAQSKWLHVVQLLLLLPILVFRMFFVGLDSVDGC